MSTTKIQKPEMLLVSIGLFIISVSTIINHSVQLPDFVSGSLMGFGIGLELVGLVVLAKNKQEKIV